MKTSLLHFAPLMAVGVLTLGMTTMGRSQPRLQADLRYGIDSLSSKGMPHQMLDEMVEQNRQRGNPSPFGKLVFPQSHIYVIDTAIVQSLGDGFFNFRDSTRYLYSFNANAKMTSLHSQKVNGDLWVDVGRVTYTYDASNNMLSQLLEDYRQWGVASSLITYTYDAGGNRLSALFEMYPGYAWRYSYTYDTANRMLSALLESLVGDQWVNNSRWSYTYDSSNNMISSSSEAFHDSLWSNRERHTFTYDASDNMLSDLCEQWSNGEWVITSRWSYTYGANNNMLSRLVEYWSDGQWSNGEWGNSERHAYTYDANNNILSDLFDKWRDGQWENYRRLTFTYDEQRNLIAFWSYSWGGSSWVPVDLPWGRAFGHTWYSPYVITDSAGNSYSYWGYNFTLTYKLVVTGIGAQSANVPAPYTLSQNYPNPFNPITTIEYKLRAQRHVSLKVFNMLGQEVTVLVDEVQQAGDKSVEFNGSGLPSGVYVYRLAADEFVAARKLVLLR